MTALVVPLYMRRFRNLTIVVVIGLVLVILNRKYSWDAYYHPDNLLPPHHQLPELGPGSGNVTAPAEEVNDPCRNFPDTEGILMVMKTGTSELFSKLPTHLLTSLQCLPDGLLFSDGETEVGEWHINDALEGIPESMMAHNKDFDLYRIQKECAVSRAACAAAWFDQQSQSSAGWNLDKYKFLPMLDKTWQMKPGFDWYVFAEADTYIFWNNLVEWLRGKSSAFPDSTMMREDTLPHHEPWYVGSVSFIGGFPFAHGGSGYAISGGLMRQMFQRNPNGLTENYDPTRTCCGDFLVARAINDTTEHKVKQAHPMFNGEKPSTLPFGPGHWCEPIITMHHMNAEEVSSVWRYQQQRDNGGTLLIKDLYKEFVEPHLIAKRTSWDNLSDDVCFLNPDEQFQKTVSDHLKGRNKKGSLRPEEANAWRSYESCREVCQLDDADEEDEESLEDDQPRQQQDERPTPQAGDGQAAKEAEQNQQVPPGGNGQDGTLRPSPDQARDGGDGGDGGDLKKHDEHSDGDTSIGSVHARRQDEAAMVRHKNEEAERQKAFEAKKEKVRMKHLSRKCFQYRWRNGVCCTAKSFKIGAPHKANGQKADGWDSGWHVKGINDWIQAKGECEKPVWKTVKDYRPPPKAPPKPQ